MQGYHQRFAKILNVTDQYTAMEIAEQTVPPQRRHQYVAAAEAWEVKRLILICP